MNNEIIKEFQELLSTCDVWTDEDEKGLTEADHLVAFLLKALEAKDKEIEALKIINTTLSNL